MREFIQFSKGFCVRAANSVVTITAERRDSNARQLCLTHRNETAQVRTRNRRNLNPRRGLRVDSCSRPLRTNPKTARDWLILRSLRSKLFLSPSLNPNEITAMPKLIDNIDVLEVTVTIDAAGCQKHIAAKIIDGGGDCVLAMKGNRGTPHTLHEAAER